VKDFLFIHLPKTGGSSVNKMLETSNIGYKQIFDNYRKFDNRGGVTFGHSCVNTLLENGIITPEFFKGSFKFCIVRNPFERAVSSYFAMKFHTKEQKSAMSPVGNSLSFEEFCVLLKKPGTITPLGMYNWKRFNQLNPQKSWISDRNGNIFVDYIGRFEDLESNSRFVFETIGIPYGGLLHEQSNDNTKNRIKNGYRDIYTSEARRLVEEIYREDFELLSYEF
jgi:hypothetical protein